MRLEEGIQCVRDPDAKLMAVQGMKRKMETRSLVSKPHQSFAHGTEKSLGLLSLCACSELFGKGIPAKDTSHEMTWAVPQNSSHL